MEAKRKIQHIDTQRTQIREYFEGSKVSNNSFDVIFNYLTLDEEDIISAVVRLMESKDLI